MGENIDIVFESFDDALIYAKEIGATYMMQKYFVEDKNLIREYKFAEVKNGKYSFFDSFEDANLYYMESCYSDDIKAHIEILKVQRYLEDLEARQNNKTTK